MALRIIKHLCVIVALVFALPAFAQERGTADEAQALVKKAVAFYKSSGRDKALAAFPDPQGGFMEKDLFVFVQNMDGVMLMHSKNPAFNGKDLSGLKDTDGKTFVAEMMKVAKEKGSGWVEYKFVNPATKKIEPKSTYVERVDDIFIGCGAFKP